EGISREFIKNVSRINRDHYQCQESIMIVKNPSIIHQEPIQIVVDVKNSSRL
ncbi:hypothetical protein PanWU01x14_150810, partial [Parasponia andersonii]